MPLSFQGSFGYTNRVPESGTNHIKEFKPALKIHIQFRPDLPLWYVVLKNKVSIYPVPIIFNLSKNQRVGAQMKIRISSIRNRNALVLLTPLFVLLVSLLLSSCTQPKINPMSLPVLSSDSQESRFPPTEDELVLRPYILLPLVTAKDQTVTEARLGDIFHFIHSSLEKNGNFSVISQTRSILEKEENRHFQPANIADAIQLGSSVNANFVSQMIITIIESKMVKNVDHFKANINLTIFTTDSGQVVIKQDVIYDSQDQEGSEKKLKELVQTYFPIRGYILETRGGRQVAKISLGRSVGIKLNRKIQIRERQVTDEIVNGSSRRTVTFGAAVLTTAEVIRVRESESWVLIDKGDQFKVKKGQVVFTLPE